MNSLLAEDSVIELVCSPQDESGPNVMRLAGHKYVFTVCLFINAKLLRQHLSFDYLLILICSNHLHKVIISKLNL